MSNLFKIAEQQLIKKKKRYKLTDVIDRAILLRKQLDDNELIKKG
jgi:hypothetical protein